MGVFSFESGLDGPYASRSRFFFFFCAHQPHPVLCGTLIYFCLKGKTFFIKHEKISAHAGLAVDLNDTTENQSYLIK